MKYDHLKEEDLPFKPLYFSPFPRVYSQSPFLRPMAHRAAPISVSIALGHASANALKATAGGWSTGSSESNFPTLFSYVERQTRRQ